MQFACIAVLIFPVEIVDTISNIRSLLDFRNETPCPDAMDASGRQEEHIARLHRIIGKRIANGIVSNHLRIFFGSNLLTQARTQMCLATVIANDIPHLGLSHRVMTLHCQFIIRMHLDRQVLLRINKLDKQREFPIETLVIVLAHQSGFVFIY